MGTGELYSGMGDIDMGKGIRSVSVIGGADGSTSIFIAGKGGRVKLTTRKGVETLWQILMMA